MRAHGGQVCHDPGVIGVPVRVHSRTGDALGTAHVPPPVRIGDVLALERGELLLLRVVDLVEMPGSPPLVKVAPVRMLVR